MYNVYNKHDKILKAWKYIIRPLRGRFPVSSCGRHAIDESDVSSVENIDVSDILGDSHHGYHKVFSSKRQKYNDKSWSVR